jgi:chemotaxis protein CheD
MDFKPKTQPFNPAVLPMEYLPRIEYAVDENHTRHYLIPGKMFVSAQPFAVSTIIGSGVVLCLWDSEERIGGANHFTLPEGPESSNNAMRYGNVANPALLKRIMELGADKKTLAASIFGGCLPNVSFGAEKEHLGDANVKTVTHFLRMNGIQLEKSEVGGLRGRKLIFHTDDGRTFSEQL